MPRGHPEPCTRERILRHCSDAEAPPQPVSHPVPAPRKREMLTRHEANPKVLSIPPKTTSAGHRRLRPRSKTMTLRNSSTADHSRSLGVQSQVSGGRSPLYFKAFIYQQVRNACPRCREQTPYSSMGFHPLQGPSTAHSSVSFLRTAPKRRRFKTFLQRTNSPLKVRRIPPFTCQRAASCPGVSGVCPEDLSRPEPLTFMGFLTSKNDLT